MNLLAFDTTLGGCSVAIRSGGRLAAHRLEDIGRGHAEALLPMIEDARTETGMEFADFDALAVTLGPGTFTGVRVGLAAARALRMALGIPVVGLGTLHVLAGGGARAAGEGAPIAVAVDARRSEAYFQAFAPGLAPSGAPEILSLAEIAARLLGNPTVLVGSAAPLLSDVTGVRIAPGFEIPDAAVLAGLAEDIAATPAFADTGPPRAMYVRAPDARLPS